ncbi:hypothetical protein CAL7716_001080 [Calothrix sp. PCC 7716]|nr:hypothetical protein CAL7716_001080 [Calothrix sp. PCC 7716]
MNEWKWSKAEEKSLARFVTDRTAELIKLPVNHFDLVQSRNGRRQLVEVIYNTLIKKDIKYTLPKYNYSDTEQRIRQPQEVLLYPGAGTCLDLALLFCGVCLGYDLLPIIIFMNGHALAAVSLNYQRSQWENDAEERAIFNTLEIFQGDKNLKKLKKLIDSDAYIAIECTGFAHTQSFSGSAPEEIGRTETGYLTFERAINAGKEQLKNSNPDRAFKFAIDITVAQYQWALQPFLIPLPYDYSQKLDVNELKKRKLLLNQVKKYWIEGFLQNSLNQAPLIIPELEEQITKIGNPAFRNLEFPQESSQTLIVGTEISEFFYDLGEGRSLLILGEPGAGKTISLLQMAKKLILRAEVDSSQPIPVVLNLSSWISEKLTITAWVVKELKSFYKIDDNTGNNWIKNHNLVLLLDGLNEVKEEYRLKCLQEINKFIKDYGETEIVVCSRMTDYQILTSKLELQTAICIKRLTDEQVHQYLESVGASLQAVNNLLKEDRNLLELAKSPLMLSIISRTYQGSSKANLPRTGSIEERRYYLFDAYIQRMLERQKENKRYSDIDTKQWLTWLANRMNLASQTIFLIERMHPSWLKNPFKMFVYSVCIGLSYGIAFGLCLGLAAALNYGVVVGVFIGLIFGFAFGVSAWVVEVGGITWLITQIVNSFAKLLDKLLGRESFKENNSDIVTTTIPNQGIWEVKKTALSYGGIGAFAGGILGLIFQREFFVLSILFGFTYGATFPGGRDAIVHFNLRLVLLLWHHIPRNYADFLNYASERIFLQKVGGGYTFYHPLLQEHFANMKK